MLLASVDDVRNEMTFDDLPDVDTAIEAALKATTRVLERRLRTDFDYGTHTDTFLVSPKWVPSQPLPQVVTNTVVPTRARVGTGLYANSPIYSTEFKLNHGFLTLLDTATVYSATLIPYLDDSGLRANLRAFEGDGLDHTFFGDEEGRLYVSQIDMRGLYVQVNYTAGFTVASDLVYDNVPDWLVRAAIIHAQIMLDKNPVIRRPEGAESQFEVLKMELDAILREKSRYFPAAVKPMNRT
jgi:hypothetical protein